METCQKEKISHNWFDLDPNWNEDKFMTREPHFFKRPHLKHIPGQTNNDCYHFLSQLATQKSKSSLI